jgi:taurine transport system substrate-binding protein
MNYYKSSNSPLRFAWYLGLAFVALPVMLGGGCGGGEHSLTVKAAYVPAGYYLPFLVVESEGLLTKRGYALELTSFQDNAQMVSLLLNDQLDVTAQSCLTMFPVEADNPGLVKYVYGQYLQSYYFVTKEGSGINDLAGIKGKKIGTWKSPTAEKFIRMCLDVEGLKYDDDYTIEKYNANQWPEMLENDVVPVVFGFDSGVAMLLSRGGYKVIAPKALEHLLPGARIFNGGGFIRTKLISRDPAKAEAIRDALLEAIEIIRTKPDRVASVVEKKLGMPPNSETLVAFDEYETPNENMYLAADQTMKLLERNGFIKKEVQVRDLFWH